MSGEDLLLTNAAARERAEQYAMATSSASSASSSVATSMASSVTSSVASSTSTSPLPHGSEDASAPLPSSSSTSATTTSSSSSTMQSPGRNLARKGLRHVGSQAAQLRDHMRESSAVFKVGFDTMGRLLKPAQNLTMHTWRQLGDPLLTQIDRQLDSALDATGYAPTSSAAAAAAAARGVEDDDDDEDYDEDEDDEDDGPELTGPDAASLTAHWARLKERFVNSEWYATVDAILLENTLVQAAGSRPADAFFNTSMDVFQQHPTDFDAYLGALKLRLGSSWDDRLTQPSRSFFTTSVAVRRVAGAGRFIGGAMQLGRRHVDYAIEELLNRWDHVLGVADHVIESLLPPLEGDWESSDDEYSSSEMMESTGLGDASPMIVDEQDQQVVDAREFDQHMTPSSSVNSLLPENGGVQISNDGAFSVVETESALYNVSPHSGSRHRLASPEEEEAAAAREREEREQSEGANKSQGSKRRSVLPLAHKISKRFRQHLPFAAEMPALLRARLLGSTWFRKVDAILRENTMVKMLQAQVVDKVFRPAEHFYNTAVDVLQKHAPSKESFLEHLRVRMGSAWDDRLQMFAVAFYQSATNVSPSTDDLSTDDSSTLAQSAAAASAQAPDAPN